MSEDLRYPIGPFVVPAEIPASRRAELIDEIAAAPAALRAAVSGLTDPQLDTPYRPGGWTVRQIVHHVPESHMNAYVRIKLGLTEDRPTIKPYNEAEWSKIPDAKGPIGPSLALLDPLHDRWVRLLKLLDDDAFRRTIVHPENGEMSLGLVVLHYAWHGKHHTAHITHLRKREGW